MKSQNNFKLLIKPLMKKEIEVLRSEIRVLKIDKDDYICLTDMLKSKDGDFLFLIG